MYKMPNLFGIHPTSSVFDWSKEGGTQDGPAFKCHLNSGQPDHLNTRQMDNILFSYLLSWYLNGRSNSVMRPFHNYMTSYT